MRIPSLALSLLLIGLPVSAHTRVPSATLSSDKGILAAPEDLKAYVLKVTLHDYGYAQKTRDILRAIFANESDGGLGLVYANDKTRTVAEVWKDRKANCISLTAFFVAACRVIDADVRFADSVGLNQWVRKGDLILHEQHVVAVLTNNPVDRRVADFTGVPRSGLHRLIPISESRFIALFHSNRAVDLLQAGHTDQALAEARSSLSIDSTSEIGWNIYGVVEQNLGNLVEAEAAYRKAIQLDPDYGAACGNLENLCRRQGQLAEASELRERGLKIRDKDPYFHAFLAKEALAAGETDDAIDQIKQALRLQHMEPDFYLILAQAELDRGEHGAAERAVQKAMRWSLPNQRKRMESKLELIMSQT